MVLLVVILIVELDNVVYTEKEDDRAICGPTTGATTVGAVENRAWPSGSSSVGRGVMPFSSQSELRFHGPLLCRKDADIALAASVEKLDMAKEESSRKLSAMLSDN